MPWEKRSKKRYYYRKRRQGDRVISDYLGSDALAEALAGLDRRQREQRQAEQAALAAMQALDAELDQLCHLIQTFIHAHLLTAGYHTHKGQWRKKRHD